MRSKAAIAYAPYTRNPPWNFPVPDDEQGRIGEEGCGIPQTAAGAHKVESRVFRERNKPDHPQCIQYYYDLSSIPLSP